VRDGHQKRIVKDTGPHTFVIRQIHKNREGGGALSGIVKKKKRVRLERFGRPFDYGVFLYPNMGEERRKRLRPMRRGPTVTDRKGTAREKKASLHSTSPGVKGEES